MPCRSGADHKSHTSLSVYAFSNSTRKCAVVQVLTRLHEAQAFSLSYNSDKTVYEIFGEHPERGRCFANAMRCFTEGTGFELHHVTDNYPWGDIPDGGTVVDVSHQPQSES